MSGRSIDNSNLDGRLSKAWRETDNQLECLSYSFTRLSKAFKVMREINEKYDEELE